MNQKDVEDIISSRENITSMLINAYNNDRLSHCYLFYGREGSGMAEMSYALALIVRCEGKIDFLSRCTLRLALAQNFGLARSDPDHTRQCNHRPLRSEIRLRG